MALMFSIAGVDAQALAERLEQVLHADGVIGHGVASGVSVTDHLPAADATPGQSYIGCPWKMIAAAARIDLRACGRIRPSR